MRNVLLLLVLLSVGVVAQALVPLATEAFTVSHPVDWQLRPANFCQALFLYPATDVAQPVVENFRVNVDKLSDNFSFDSYTFMAKHHVESDFPGLKLVRSQPVKVSKLQGHRFDYAGPHEGRELQIVQVMTMKDNLGYTLWFVATPANYKKYSGVAENMIRSFKVN